MICAWMFTSSAEIGSSADDELRVDRQRAGDRDALPLPAGELVRITLRCCGREADRAEQLAHACRAAVRSVMPWKRSGSASDIAHRHARVERRVRVLEDHLHPAAQRPDLAGLARRDRPCRRTGSRPASGSWSRDQRAAERRSCRSRISPTTPTRLAAADVRSTPSTACTHPLGPKKPPAQREMLHQRRAPSAAAAAPAPPASRATAAPIARAGRREMQPPSAAYPAARRRPGRHHRQQRRMLGALLDSERAARLEAAARRPVRAGRAACPRWSSAAPPALPVQPRHRVQQRPGVGCRGSASSCSVGPSSTTSPAYITTTREQTLAMTPRSWLIRTIAVPKSRVELAQQVEDLRLDRDVERRRRLVGDAAAPARCASPSPA